MMDDPLLAMEQTLARLAQDPLEAPVPTLPAAPEAPSYYDISMLQAPVWSWEVAAYFFLGGLSAGAYVLARLAERFGGARYQALTRAGTAIAALTVLPCAPLLIMDLGDSKRFHHMLRVFKPQSPMNLGAWTLTAYSGSVALAVLREWLKGSRTPAERSAAGRVVDGTLLAVTDGAGIPLALLLAGYTGVLLSGTSTPVWSRNHWLGPLFSAGAISTGAEAISLVLGARAVTEGVKADTVRESLNKVDTAAHAAEALTLAGFLAAAGSLAEPLTAGKVSGPFWGGIVAGAASEVLKVLPLRGRARRWADLAASALGLASGFALRWTLVRAGPPSARNPEAARQASRPARTHLQVQ